jgi:putative transferase (TIGR04331 family)
MFLALTALTECWDIDDDILAVGPWCLRYDRKEEWEHLRCTVMPSPWKDPRAIEEAADYCGKVIDALMADLTMYLNHAHGVQFSERYWRILLCPWIHYYVHALYDRYVTLKRTLESHRELTTSVLSPAVYVTPANTADFSILTYGEPADFFNLQLFSQIIRSLNRPAISLKEVTPSRRELPRPCANRGGCSCTASGAHGSWSKRLIRRVATILTCISRPRAMLGWLCLDRKNLWRLVWAMAFRGRALPAPHGICSPVQGPDGNLRSGLSSLPATDEFARILNKTLAVNLPLIYMEGYQAFRKSCLAAWPSPPAVLFSLESWYTHEAFKFLAAEYSERGSRLVGGQHGEGYGASKVITSEGLELAVADRWYSFGWYDHQRSDKIRPLPHPMFLPARSARTRHEGLRDILLAAHSMPRYQHKFESHPPASRFGEALEWRTRFVSQLPDQLRARLLVRLHHDDRGWGQHPRLLDACGPLTFDDRKQSLRLRMSECRLAVTDYRGTALLEMLVENMPMLAFWDPGVYELRKDAEPYFEALRNAGILWDSPEAAAVKLSEIYDDPWQWWNEKKVQEARQAFVSQFALGREDWLNQWTRALEEELALSRIGDGSGQTCHR